MIRTDVISDKKVRSAEELFDQTGKRIATSELAKVVLGEVEILHSGPNGRQVFTRRNDLLVTGGVFLSEKINNLRSTFRPASLDVSLGIHTPDEIDTTKTTIPSERVIGMVIGNGGCGDTYNSVKKVHRTDLTVPGMIPYRMIPVDSGDLPDTEKAKYFLRIVKDGYICYYGKKPSAVPEISVLYEDNTPVPLNVSVIGDADGRFIKTFTKYIFDITEAEVREYYKYTQGSTIRSRINSIGLVTGYPMSGSEAEYGYVRGLTTLNFENAELKDNESVMGFTYRLHFV